MLLKAQGEPAAACPVRGRRGHIRERAGPDHPATATFGYAGCPLHSGRGCWKRRGDPGDGLSRCVGNARTWQPGLKISAAAPALHSTAR